MDGKIIGWVAAGGYGYSVKKSIVYAYVPVEHSKPGTKLEIEFFGEKIGAEVVSSPYGIQKESVYGHSR